MPSRSTTLADERCVEAAQPAAGARAKDLPLLHARILAVGAWIVAPIVIWGGAIAAVIHLIQRVR